VTQASGGTRGWLPIYLMLGLVWGTSFLFLRTAAQSMGPLPTAWGRVTLAALCLLPLLAWKGQLTQMIRLWKPMIVMGMLNSGLPFLCYSYAVQSLPISMTSVLNATTPLLTALIAWAWLGERLNSSRAFGLLLGLVGVALLTWRAPGDVSLSDGGLGLPMLACLMATTSYGLSSSFNQRYLSQVPPLVSATGSQLGASLGLLVPALWSWPDHAPSAQAWMALGALSVFCTALAYLWFFWLMGRIGAARSSTVIFMVPVVSTTLGMLLLDEEITPWMMGCASLILLGTALSLGLLRWPRR
jgi:drug/metabolite transporter (DMT)-like permease